MALAEGRWAWWNNFGHVPLDVCARRAREAALRGVIVKWGYPEARAAFVEAGIAWAVERYVYPDQPELEAQRLAEGIAQGARFAVINAEVEWETVGSEPMRRLIAEFRRRQPRAELYASVDTRGGRMSLPYQQVLLDHVVAVMPMVFPKAFRPSQPPGYVPQAFQDCLEGDDFRGKPVLPTIQTYDDIGPSAVAEQLAELGRRGLAGYQAYTIAHATDEEWAVLVREAEEERRMREAIEELRREQAELRRFQVAAGLFAQAASHALRGERLPEHLRVQLRFLLG